MGDRANLYVCMYTAQNVQMYAAQQGEGGRKM